MFTESVLNNKMKLTLSQQIQIYCDSLIKAESLNFKTSSGNFMFRMALPFSSITFLVWRSGILSGFRLDKLRSTYQSYKKHKKIKKINVFDVKKVFSMCFGHLFYFLGTCFHFSVFDNFDVFCSG